MNPADILLAVPTRGSVRGETLARLTAVRDNNPGVNIPVFSTGHISAHETREQIVGYFMQTNKEVLLMCDDDIVPPGDILGMVDALDDFDIIGAAAPCFQPAAAPIPMLMAYDYFPEQNAWRTLHDVWGRTGVVEVDAVGFGAVMIHRRVFEKIEPPYFPMEYNATGTTSDDVSFCRRAKEYGFRVACDFDRYCEHHTTVPLMRLAQGMSDYVDEMLKLVSIRTELYGRSVQQTDADLAAWETFLHEHPMTSILELGTGSGGMSMWLSERCDSFRTVDHTPPREETPGHVTMDIFDPCVAEFVASAERPFLVFCDGGDKPGEVAHYAPLLREGDYLAVHDYGREINDEDIPVCLVPVLVDGPDSFTRFYQRA